MKNLKKRIISLAFISFLTSCVSAAIESNRETGYTGSLEKVAVIVESGNIKINHKTSTENYLSAYLAENVVKTFIKLGIDCKAFRKTGLELNEDQIEKDVKEYSPKQILTLELKEGTVVEGIVGTVLVRGSFSASLNDIASDRIVWKAKLELSAHYGVGSSAIDQLINDLIKTFQKDLLIKK